MTDTAAITKSDLLDALRASRDELITTLRAVPAAAFDEGRYESGWNGHDILAHVAAIEWTYVRLLDVAKQAPGEGAARATGAASAPADVRRTTPEEAAGLPTRTAQGGIDSYNARMVEKRCDASIDGLLAEFAKNRDATIAAIEAADEALLQTPIRSAGGITGPLGAVIRAVAVEHVLGHAADIAGEAAAERRW